MKGIIAMLFRKYRMFIINVIVTILFFTINCHADSININEEKYIHTRTSEDSISIPFFDSFENGIGKWTLESSWCISTDDSYTGNYNLSDSENTSYKDNADYNAQIKLDLISKNRPLLTFYHRYNFEQNNDFGFIEISNNDSSSWRKLFFVTGYTGNNWSKVNIDLSEYANQIVLLRFHITTNSSVSYDGWHIDNLSIQENNNQISYPFYDDIENSINSNWIESTWGIVSTDSHSGSYCISDSPDSTIPSSVKTDLVLKGLFDFNNVINPFISFWHKRSSSYILQVFISNNAGSSWNQIANLSSNTTWQNTRIDLSKYIGLSDISIKFQSIGNKNDGYFIDDILVDDAPSNIFLHKPENVSGDKIKLSWTENTDSDFYQYEIYRSFNQNVSRESTLIAYLSDSTITQYTDTEITKDGTTFYYKVFVMDTQGFVNQGSNEVSCKSLSGESNLINIVSEFPFINLIEEHDNLFGSVLPWAVTDEDANSGLYSWTDSPNKPYQNDTDRSIYFKANLTSVNRPLLSFWHKYNFEQDKDYGFLEISNNNSETWKKIYFTTGYSGNQWSKVNIDISEYAHQIITIRYHIITNSSITYDGWYIDDVSIQENDLQTNYPFFDSIEKSSENNWIESTWGTVSTDSHAGSYCLADSPETKIPNSVSTDLVLKGTLDFTNVVNPYISFWHKRSSAYVLFLYISNNGGNNWNQIANISSNSTWQNAIIDLSKYIGLANIAIKFQSIGNNNDGYFIDDILIDDAPTNVIMNIPKSISGNQIQLSWTENIDSDFFQYELYRSESPNIMREANNAELITTLSNSATLKYTDTHITKEGQTFYYKIYVKDTQGFINQGSNEVTCKSLSGESFVQNADFPFIDQIDEKDNTIFGSVTPWIISDEDSHSGLYSWSDSPGEPYKNNTDRSLYLKINLSSANRPLLSFWQRYNFEKDKDYGYVEISNNDGSSWKKLFYVTGYSGNQWFLAKIDLSEYARQNLLLRFRIITNSTITYDGWHIDDITIQDNSTQFQFPFYDSMGTNLEPNWIESTWGFTSTDSYSGNYCVSDSPDTKIPNGVYSDLVLKGTLDFTQATNPYLSFWHKRESSYILLVFISNNGGNYWNQIANVSSSSQWQNTLINLSEYAGLTNIAIKFQSIGNNNGGYYIDEVKIHDFYPDINISGIIYGNHYCNEYIRINNATVQISNQSESYDTDSSLNGFFSFNNISNGNYTLTISAMGFKTYSSQINFSGDNVFVGNIYLQKDIVLGDMNFDDKIDLIDAIKILQNLIDFK